MGGAAPIVRIPVGEFATVSRALDFGAEGIIAPMINTPADARAFAAAAKFPPLGERSWGPHRATDARQHARPEGLSARGQRPHRHLRHDRDARPPSTMSRRSPRRPASTRCSSVPPTSRSRSSNGANVDPHVEGGRPRARPHHRGGAARPARSRAPIATPPSAPSRSPSAACASSRSAATWASCAPARRPPQGARRAEPAILQSI